MSNEYLQFETADGTLIERVGWSPEGPWPPPEVMCQVIGKQSRAFTWTEPENVAAGRADAPDFDDHVEVERFVRISASELPADTGPHVARGALYRPEAGHD